MRDGTELVLHRILEKEIEQLFRSQGEPLGLSMVLTSSQRIRGRQFKKSYGRSKPPFELVSDLLLIGNEAAFAGLQM